MKDAVTKKFLHLLSSHLSGRRECSNIEYEILITREGNYTLSVALPCYPDVKHRAKSYQQNPVMHIIEHHMPEISACQNNMLDTNMIVDGRYKYAYNINRTRRKWIKEE